MTDLARDLDSLVPPFDDSDADWQDALRRSRGRRKWPVVLAAAALVTAMLTTTAFGTALAGDAFDRLTAWVSGAPGDPASEAERRALEEANARSAAPIPADTELGLLASKTLHGVYFELLGFRDRASLCLRLRSSTGQGGRIAKAPASCVSEELLVDLGKPLAVVSAADPFPRRAKPGLQALYGLAADRVAAVELTTERGLVRVPVENNAFLYLYRGESPRQVNSRLQYLSDVPSRATGLDTIGRAVGSVEIMSLKRGYPGGPPAARLPGPDAVDHPLKSQHIGWLDRGEKRGEPYEWRLPDGSKSPGLEGLRILHPNPGTSARVVVFRSDTGLAGQGPSYCATNVWPLQPRPTGYFCRPVDGPSETIGLVAATTVFDAQFPVYYGLAPDGVASLELVLANGAREKIPITDNVVAFQASSAEPAKLVGYDSANRVVLIQVLAY